GGQGDGGGAGLSCRVRGGGGRARALDPGSPPCAPGARGEGDHGHARRDRRGEKGTRERVRAAGGRRAAPQGAVAPGLRGCRELDGLSRATRARADPRRSHRPRAAGSARGGAGAAKALIGGSVRRRCVVVRALVFVAMSGLAGCASSSPPLPSASDVVLGTFVGLLPCADCAAIRTELRLYAEPRS